MSDKIIKSLFPNIDWFKYSTELQDATETPLYKLFESAKNDFTKKKIIKVMNLEYDLDRIESLKGLRAYELELESKKREIVRPQRCMFITVNPKPDVELSTFLTVLHKYANRAMFSRVLYTVEQRGTVEEGNLGKGFHAHLLVCRANGYPPNKIKKHTFSTFKHLIGNDASIDYGGRYCIVANREKYIIGEKKDPHKHAKQDGDKVWRLQHSIEPYYGKLFSK